jgi:hypothetical protein
MELSALQRKGSPRLGKAALGIAALALTAGNVRGAIWTETGDANQTVAGAQGTTGSGPLTAIVGSVIPNDRVDMFVITITDPLLFSASTVGGAAFDTQLFLFTMAGMGVAHSDDTATSTQSTLTGQFVPAPGNYLLAISIYDRDPVSALGQALWNDTPFTTERAPDGPAAGSPLANWGGSSGAGGAYTIGLTGATFSTLVPAPGTVMLAGLAGLAMVSRRRS